MKSNETLAIPPRLEAARRRFEHWRQTRKRRSPIPDKLWSCAVELSTMYGIARTAKALRLNGDTLRKHAASAGSNGSPAPAAATRFVEMIRPREPCSPECVVELENPRGAKMRIQLAGGQGLAVVATVSKVFFGVDS